MKKLTWTLLSIFFIFTVTVSGCVQLGEEKGSAKYGNGLVITSFSAFPETVFSGEDYKLSAEVQNKGGVKAEEIGFYVYNAKVDEPFKSMGDRGLEAPSEEFSGAKTSRMWSASSPSVNVKKKISPKLRVYYKYKTLASVDIPVITMSERKRRLRKGEELPSREDTTVTHGPFSVNIQSRSPVTVKSGEPKSFRVSITGSNLLDGTAYLSSEHPEDESDIPVENGKMNRATLSVKTTSDVVEKDEGCFEDSEELLLREGQNFRHDCTVKVEEDQVTVSEQIPITVELNYGYLFDRTTSLTIKKEI